MTRKSISCRVSVLSVAFFLAGSSVVGGAAPCNPYNSVLKIASSGYVDFAGQGLPYEGQTAVSFSEIDGDQAQVNQVTEFKFADLIGRWPQLFNANVPVSSCEDRYKPHGQVLGVDGAGNIVAKGDVTYEKWSCGWTKGICSRGLRFYSCRWEHKTFIFRKTISIVTNIKPSVSSGRLSLTSTSSVDDQGGIPAIVSAIIGGITGGLGVLTAEKVFRDAIDDIEDQLPRISVALDSLDSSTDSFSKVAKMEPKAASFVQNGEVVALEVRAQGILLKNTACFAIDRINAAASP